MDNRYYRYKQLFYLLIAAGMTGCTAMPEQPSISGSYDGNFYRTSTKGACYTYSSTGKKRYVERSKCS